MSGKQAEWNYQWGNYYSNQQNLEWLHGHKLKYHQRFVDSQWTTPQVSHPADNQISGVYIFERIPIEFVQSYECVWYVEPPKNVNIIMGRVFGKIMGVAKCSVNGLKTTGFNHNIHCKFATSHNNNEEIKVIGRPVIHIEPEKLPTPRVSTTSKQSFVDSVIEARWDRYDMYPSREVASLISDRSNRVSYTTLNTSEAEFADWLEEAYSLGSGRKKYGLRD